MSRLDLFLDRSNAFAVSVKQVHPGVVKASGTTLQETWTLPKQNRSAGSSRQNSVVAVASIWQMPEQDVGQLSAESGPPGRFEGSVKIAEPTLVQHPLQGLSLLANPVQTPPASPQPDWSRQTGFNFTERLFQRDRSADHSSTPQLRRSQSASSLPVDVELPRPDSPPETPDEEASAGHFIGFTDGLSRAHSHDSIPSPSVDLERQSSGRRPPRRPLSSIEISTPPPQSPSQRLHLAPAHSDSFTRHLMNQVNMHSMYKGCTNAQGMHGWLRLLMDMRTHHAAS